jgi:hypothetical protein
LLPRYDIQPGAFGPGGAAELPMVLHALAGSYAVLRAWLGSPYLANALAAGSLLTALRQSRHLGSAGGDEGPPVVSRGSVQWRTSGGGGGGVGCAGE